MFKANRVVSAGRYGRTLPHYLVHILQAASIFCPAPTTQAISLPRSARLVALHILPAPHDRFHRTNEGTPIALRNGRNRHSSTLHPSNLPRKGCSCARRPVGSACWQRAAQGSSRPLVERVNPLRMARRAVWLGCAPHLIFDIGDENRCLFFLASFSLTFSAN